MRPDQSYTPNSRRAGTPANGAGVRLHPNVATALNNLAQLLKATNRPAEADAAESGTSTHGQGPCAAGGREPRVIGVDDWALRRGQAYGTLIVDLERHQPLELLADRKWETFRDWLTQHPAVEVISRDRAECYAHGALAGAPQATQVADRWHLLQNLREALKKLAERFLPEIWQVVRKMSDQQATARQPTPTSDNVSHATSQDSAAAEAPSKKCGDFRRELRRSRRVERFERVHELHQKGHSQREIARILGLNRKTVRRFLHSGSFPERAVRRRAKRLPAATWIGRRSAA